MVFCVSFRTCVYVLLSVFAVMPSCGQAECPWPQKTGPLGNGNTPASWPPVPDAWDETTQQNIAWKIELAGLGHCTPVLGNGKAWFTAANDDGTQMYVYCVDTENGKTIHHKLLFENESPEELGNPINNYAAPSCVLDDDAIYVHFGTYGTARLDPQTAQVVWQRRDINVRHFRGPGSSPVLWNDSLILTFDGIDHQFVTALDTATGKTLWQTERTTDYHDLDANGKALRDGDMRKAYGTPAVIAVDGADPQLVSVGSMAAFGYDPRTGKELWTITHDDMNAAAQPMPWGNLAIVNTGGRGANLLAVKLQSDTRGNVDQSHVVWNRPKGNSRMAFPVMFDDRIISVTDTGVVNCVDAQTGESIWTDRIGGNHIASPLVDHGRVFFFTIEGESVVIDPSGDKMKVLRRNQLDEGMRASPAAADGALFLRTHTHLYKIAAAPSDPSK